MKFHLLNSRVRQLATAVVLSAGAVVPAWAAQVNIPNPEHIGVSVDVGMIDVVFQVMNTGFPINIGIDIGSIQELVKTDRGNTAKYLLSTDHIATTCGGLGVGDSCNVNAYYDVSDADPSIITNDYGIWGAEILVPWTTTDGMRSGSALGTAVVAVFGPEFHGVLSIPESSTWVMMLVGFGVLGLAGLRKAKVGAA